MSKSILVMETPTRRSECSLLVLEGNVNYCTVTGGSCALAWRPDRCPLQELPERKQMRKSNGEYIQDDFEAGRVYGWNDCLEEIVKGQ